jgi:hypothetical protein
MAMENYSLSDIAAASGNDGGLGGCNSWVLIILFALIFGNGGFGFGNGNANAAVTESAMCNMNNFQQLENAVGRLSDAQAQQNMMISNGMCNLGYQNLEQFGSLQRDLCTGFANGVAATNNASAQARECCCETNRNIDQLRYDSAMNTAAINANISEKFAALEKNQLQQTIDAQQNQINQLYINSQLCGVVRYPNGMTYNAGNSPFCGGGCCGNI